MNKIIIYGAGGFAREVHNLCEELRLEVLGFLDERPEMRGKILNGIPILGDIGDVEDWLHNNGYSKSRVNIVSSGVGDPALKQKFAEKTLQAGYDIAGPLIHPGVKISRWVEIGQGSIICQGTVLTVNIKVGNYVLINQICSIGHDDEIGHLVTISPGANVSGAVTIGAGTYIGTGASIRENITIGEWSVVAGSAFVKHDVPPHSLVAGVPAVLKKKL